jgi:hypothetical protein
VTLNGLDSMPARERSQHNDGLSGSDWIVTCVEDVKRNSVGAELANQRLVYVRQHCNSMLVSPVVERLRELECHAFRSAGYQLANDMHDSH